MIAVMRRGANVALTREVPHLTGVVLGVRFDAGAETLVEENIVVAAVLCDSTGRAPDNRHFVFFNQLSSPEESVARREQTLGGDDEQIEIDLVDVPADIARVVVVSYLNEGIAARRSLGRLRSCMIRVLDLANGVELVRSEDLATGLTTETGLALGEMYRHQGGWKFRVLGAGYDTGIRGLAAEFGVRL